MDKLVAESLLRLSQEPDGVKFLKSLEEDFDKAMQTLLYAKPEDLPTAQGTARALHEQLKKFVTARKVIEAG